MIITQCRSYPDRIELRSTGTVDHDDILAREDLLQPLEYFQIFPDAMGIHAYIALAYS